MLYVIPNWFYSVRRKHERKRTKSQFTFLKAHSSHSTFCPEIITSMKARYQNTSTSAQSRLTIFTITSFFTLTQLKVNAFAQTVSQQLSNKSEKRKNGQKKKKIHFGTFAVKCHFLVGSKCAKKYMCSVRNRLDSCRPGTASTFKIMSVHAQLKFAWWRTDQSKFQCNTNSCWNMLNFWIESRLVCMLRHSNPLSAHLISFPSPVFLHRIMPSSTSQNGPTADCCNTDFQLSALLGN